MNHPEEAPKLPLLPFAIGDILLIATAAVIATRSGTPISPGELLAITVCVVFGAALLVVPFLANYTRQKDAELTERQNQIAALARTTAESAEQLSIAAAGLHGIAESSKHNVEAIAKLPAKLQERVNEIAQQLAGAAGTPRGTLKDELAQLQSASEKIARAVTKLDAAATAGLDGLASRKNELSEALVRAAGQIDALVADAVTRAVRTSEPEPAMEPKPKATKSKTKTEPSPSSSPIQEEASSSEQSVNSPAVSAADAANPAPEPAPPPLPPPVSPPAEPSAPAVTAPSEHAAEPIMAPPAPFAAADPAPKAPRARKSRFADDIPDLGLTPDPSDAPETALTSDGFTRLIATAYIGIGNKLYIRGDGPGLSWDKGTPLQFVSIGKWRWETADATGPIRVKLYKNDQIECSGLGELTLEPAHQHEVNAGF